MAKKANKSNVDKVVKKVNKEFEKTSSQIEALINDALKQFDHLQNQVQEPVRKMLKDVDDLREREMKRFNEEFERRVNEFHELQNNLLERLGFASKEAKDEVKKAANKSSAKKAGGKKSAAKKPAGAKPKTAKAKSAKTKTAGASATSPTSATKAAPKKAAASKKPATAKKPAAPRAPKAADKGDLTRIKGIGAVTARKMKEAGITSIDQIANPSEDDKEKLQAFSNVRGFSTFTDEAKKLS